MDDPNPPPIVALNEYGFGPLVDVPIVIVLGLYPLEGVLTIVDEVVGGLYGISAPCPPELEGILNVGEYDEPRGAIGEVSPNTRLSTGVRVGLKVLTSLVFPPIVELMPDTMAPVGEVVKPSKPLPLKASISPFAFSSR